MLKSLTAAALLLVAPGAVLAGSAQDLCDARARAATGYHGGRIPDVEVGPVTLRIGGSVAIGVSRSSGSPLANPAPRGAGAYAREQRQAAQAKDYRAALDSCLATR